MRYAWLVLMLAGCDAVYGLKRDPQRGDEDGDGTIDVEDACPHIANESPIDVDDDGISIDCDPDDADPTTLSRWFPLRDRTLDDDLRLDGIGDAAADGFTLGSHTGLSALTFDVNTGTAVVDIGFEILSSSVEDDRVAPWAEIGVMTVHRGFVPPREIRGDVCFLGVNLDTTVDPPVVGTAYLEPNEDAVQKQISTFASPLDGEIGRLHQRRTPDRVECSVVRPMKPTENATFAVEDLATQTGAIAISAERMVVRLDYVWLAWQP